MRLVLTLTFPFGKQADTAAWFKANWLPTKDFAREGTFFGSIAKSTERKIDIQKNSAKRVATTATTKSA